MSQGLIKLTSCLVLGLLIGCSGSSDPASPVVLVTPNQAGDNGTNPGSAADTGGDTESDTGTAGGNTDDGSTDTADTPAGDSTDAGTVDGGDTTTGTATAGTDTDGETVGGTTDVGTTDGAVTDGTGTDGTGTDGTGTDGTGTDGTGTDGTGTDGTGTDGTGTDGTGTDGTGTDGTGTDGTGTGGPTDPPSNGSLSAILESEDELSMAFAALEASGLADALNDDGNVWTVFLPNNAALTAQPEFDIQRHISVVDSISSADLSEFNGLTLLMNDGSTVTVDGGGLQDITIANATVITSDIMGDTGSTVVHIIDRVIDDVAETPGPSEGSLANALVENGTLSIVLDLLKAEDLDTSLDDPTIERTLFLPNDAALDTPEDFLSAVHIASDGTLNSTSLTGLSGSGLRMNSGDVFEIGGGGTDALTIGGFTIVEVDLQNEDMEGTVVHIINGVLVPVSEPEPEPEE